MDIPFMSSLANRANHSFFHSLIIMLRIHLSRHLSPANYQKPYLLSETLIFFSSFRNADTEELISSNETG